MSNYRVASRYAKSLIELSQEKGILEAIKDDMVLFHDAVTESRDLALLLKSPIVAPNKKASVLKELFASKVNELTLMFFNIICKKGRESFLESIASEFLNQYNKVKGVVKAQVVTAVALSSGAEAKVIAAVKEATKANEVKLESVIDESIIGGYILTIDDKQVDDSVKGRLTGLRNELVR